MMGRDLESDLDMLTGDWGMHEVDWFRVKGTEVAIYGIEKALEYKANNKRLLNILKRVYMVSKVCGLRNIYYKEVGDRYETRV
jgi:hypothetical protein